MFGNVMKIIAYTFVGAAAADYVVTRVSKTISKARKEKAKTDKEVTQLNDRKTKRN